jgi:hypothetical protein
MVKFDFIKRDIVMMAAFLALMMAVEVVWVVGPVIGNLIYPVIFGAILITAARVIRKRYSILILLAVDTIITLSTAHLYGGTLAAVAYITGAIPLEGVLQLREPYGENKNMDLLGILAYGLVSAVTYVAVMVLIYGMALPIWAMIGLIIVPLVPYVLGGFIGFRIGGRVKNVMESM